MSTDEVSPPLYEVIDPDALNALFARDAHESRAVEVGFEYAGYHVHLIGTGAESVAVTVQSVATDTGVRPTGSIRTED